MMEILTTLDEQCARRKARRERGEGGGREKEGGGKEGNVGTGKKARVL